MTLIQFIMIALQTHRVSDTRSLRVDTPVRLLSGSGTRDINLFRRNNYEIKNLAYAKFLL